MFIKSNQIIIVDDIPDDLVTLSKPFHDQGIGCKTFEYDAFYNQPLSDVKVAFFDINLNPTAGGDESQKFSTLADAIKKYISKKNGPFVLVFWTNQSDEIKKFIDWCNVRKDTELPNPFHIANIDKPDFIGQSISDLPKKLSEILKEKPIQLMFDFEEQVAMAAATTVKQIFDIIPRNEGWGENDKFNVAFEQVFSKLAACTLGLEHAKAAPDKAIYETLTPILGHYLSNAHGEDWKVYLRSLAVASKINELRLPTGFQVGKLNRTFHIDDSINAYPLNQRGTVFEVNTEEPIFSSHFKMSFKEWIRFYSKKNLSEDVLGKTKSIAIEISSACDHSQQNPRVNKYILGIITPAGFKSKFKSMLELGEFFLENETRQIILNMNYVFSCLSDDERMRNAIFTFKKEMVDYIGNHYANHSSRIGITTFR